MINWNKTANEIVAKLIGNKSHKRKKSQNFDKILTIPIQTKERIIIDFLQNSKLQFLSEIRAGKKNVKFNSLIDKETIRKYIISLSTEKFTPNKRLTIVANEKKIY